MSSVKSTTRRQFVTLALAGASLASPISAVIATRAVSAAELPRLDERERAAEALGYVHDATGIAASTRGGADRICATCRFYADETASAWGPCTLFPGKAVNANGWCRGWVARSG